ncbi:DUF2651 family protein [Clostridioides difficile]
MSFLYSIDPFILQLVLIPIVVISIGILIAILIKKFYIGPIITLILNTVIELYLFNNISIWCIVFSILSLVLSFLFVKTENIDYK